MLDEILTVVCQSKLIGRELLAVCGAFLVVLLALLPTIESGSGTYVITVVTIVLLLCNILTIGTLQVLCRRRQRDVEPLQS